MAVMPPTSSVDTSSRGDVAPTGTPAPTISVIIPVLNAATTLGRQLEALARQDWLGAWELIIADNGSEDASVRIAKSYQHRIPDLTVLDARAVKGCSHAYNAGASVARGDWLLFCDADDEVTSGWISAMAQGLRDHPVVGGRFEPSKLNPGWLQRTRTLPQQDSLQPGFAPLFLPHLGSGNLGIYRRLFEDMRGFREDMPVFADTDLSWRLQLQGIPLQFLPDAVVHVSLRSRLHEIYLQGHAYGLAQVRLRALHASLPGRSRPLPLELLVVFLLGWLPLVVHLLRVRDRAEFGNWLWKAGWRVGRFHGWLEKGRRSCGLVLQP